MKYFILLMFLFISLISCKNDDDSQNCDCQSETISTIQNIEGILYPNNSDLENIPDSNFVIVWTNQENTAWQTSYYVCNDNLVNQLGTIPEAGMEVSFSGKTKDLCENPISIPENSHFKIELTQISTQ